MPPISHFSCKSEERIWGETRRRLVNCRPRQRPGFGHKSSCPDDSCGSGGSLVATLGGELSTGLKGLGPIAARLRLMLAKPVFGDRLSCQVPVVHKTAIAIRTFRR